MTSLAAGLAPDSGVLIAARFAQGASAALVAPMALATVTDLYRDGPGRARALGIFQGATAAGASAGIVLGGILTSLVGWRAIFLVNPPVIVILVAAMLRLLPRDARHGAAARTGEGPAGNGAPPEITATSVGQNGPSKQTRDQAAGGPPARLDVAGAALVTTSVAALIFGLSQGQQRGFGASLILGALVAAVLLGVAFVAVERRVAAPMVPLRVLADGERRLALGAMFVVASVIVGYVYFVTLYMQRVLGFSPLRAGLGLLPATLTVLVTSTSSASPVARAIHRTRPFNPASTIRYATGCCLPSPHVQLSTHAARHGTERGGAGIRWAAAARRERARPTGHSSGRAERARQRAAAKAFVRQGA